jgi:hypothetical protein
MMMQHDMGRLMHKPIVGGAFGQGDYALATMPAIRHGLHAVRFFVVGIRSGVVLSIADDKVDAIGRARQLLEAANELGTREVGFERGQHALWAPDEMPPIDPPARKVSRRRRAIFDNSKGSCHYCSRPLALDGKWHVEHMLPRALGGADDKLNLVAACVDCNLRKGDRSALEFLAGR